jgi:hypothetical protein
MKFKVLILFCCVLLFISCKKESKQITPTCIESKIKDFSIIGNSCEVGAIVKEFNFQGKTVYVFDMGSCGGDLPIDVLDSDCISLGTLGGFSGNTKINGVEFSTAVYIKTIWQR